MDSKTGSKQTSHRWNYQGYAKIESSGLTADQKQAFWDILKRYDEDAVEKFIDGLDICLRDAAMSLWSNAKMGNKTNIRKHKMAMLRAIERAIYHCEKFLWPETLSLGKPGAPQPPPEKFPLRYFRDEVMPLFEDYYALIQLRDKLKKELSPASPGRPPDQEIQRIVDLITYFYRKCIGKPTSYKEGPLSGVVQISLQLLDLPHQDPSRLIKHALSQS